MREVPLYWHLSPRRKAKAPNEASVDAFLRHTYHVNLKIVDYRGT